MAKQYAYVVWTNTDRTEGRGHEYPLEICKLESTAIRIGKGKYDVQGCDCPITKVRIFEYNRKHYGPIYLTGPSKEDLEIDEKLQKEREKQEKRLTILEKARSLGLSDEEIELLKEK